MSPPFLVGAMLRQKPIDSYPAWESSDPGEARFPSLRRINEKGFASSAVNRPSGSWVVHPGLALPERAAALGLRSQVLAVRLSAPHSRADTLAEVPAGVTSAEAFGDHNNAVDAP